MLKFSDLKPGMWLVSPWGNVICITIKEPFFVKTQVSDYDYAWVQDDAFGVFLGGWEILGRE